MTSVFILLWVALSVFIIGIFIWTTRALMEQKLCWRGFAGARGLKYTPNRFFQSALVAGKLDGNDFTLISDERATSDVRGRKFVTLIQFGLPVRMPAPGVVGSGEYLAFANNMGARDELDVTAWSWDNKSIAAKTDDHDKIMPYFTADRLKVLETMAKQKGVSMLFLFDERAAFLRLETIDPMLKRPQLDKLIDKVLPMLRVLHP
jgi:hypothetical protein